VGAASGLAGRADPTGVAGTDDGSAGGGVALDALEATNGSHDGTGRGEAIRTRPPGRRLTWRVLLFSLILLALVGGAFATIQWYGRSTYFVGFEGDRVAIFKGRPGGVLWLNPVLEETFDIERSHVPADTRDDLDAGKEQSSLDDAQRYVDRLSERADTLAADTTTTTRPTTTTTAPRTTTTTRPRTTTTQAR
jgi:protein phosphatase